MSPTGPNYQWRIGPETKVRLGPERPWIMGILNVTPDSFSDGGRYYDLDAAVRHGIQLAEDGADVIDVGGESTRPQAEPVPEDEEIRRVVPVIETLSREVSIPISVDTMKPRVAARAIEKGACIVNDVGANRASNEMWRLVAEAQVGYVLMHMQGAPQTMQSHPDYENVVDAVFQFFTHRRDRFLECGGAPEQLVFDVGIGFGKSVEHNLTLLRATETFTQLQRPMLLGVSRKSFIGKLLGLDPGERTIPSIVCGLMAVERGASILRVHDVRAHAQALRMRSHWSPTGPD